MTNPTPCRSEDWTSLVPLLVGEGATDGALMTLWALYFGVAQSATVLESAGGETRYTQDIVKAVASFRNLSEKQVRRHLSELGGLSLTRSEEGGALLVRHAKVALAAYAPVREPETASGRNWAHIDTTSRLKGLWAAAKEAKDKTTAKAEEMDERRAKKAGKPAKMERRPLEGFEPDAPSPSFTNELVSFFTGRVRQMPSCVFAPVSGMKERAIMKALIEGATRGAEDVQAVLEWVTDQSNWDAFRQQYKLTDAPVPTLPIIKGYAATIFPMVLTPQATERRSGGATNAPTTTEPAQRGSFR